MSDGPPPQPVRNAEPFREFVQAVQSDLSAQAVAVWMRNGVSETFQFVASTGTNQVDPFQSPAIQQQLSALLVETIAAGEERAVNVTGLGNVGLGGEAQGDHSTLLLVPLRHQQQPLGIVAVWQRGELSQDERSRQLKVLTGRATGFIAQLFSIESGRGQVAQTPHSVDARVVLGFVHNLQRSLDVNEVAGVAVNDGRLLFGADRVSLVMRRGRRAVVTAVSGQESVHPRGNLIRSMRTLAGQVLSAGEPLRYDGSLDKLPSQLEKPLADFVQEGGARFLLMVPLLEPERLVKPEESSGNAKPVRAARRTLGVLVVEQMQNSEPSPQLTGTLDAVVDHIAAAVFNAKTHSAIFLLPLWRAIGRFCEWLRGRRLAIATVVAALLIAFGVSLVAVPWPYRVDATGRLMPVIQREVFAPWDGQVVELLVHGGERVAEGEILLKLRNDELSAELVTVENQLQEKRKLHSSLIAQRDAVVKQGNRDEELKLQGKAVETKVEIEGAALQSTVLKDRLARLTVRAPLAGVVTTFQAQQLLLNRPVKRGDLLLQVMDETGDWQLELEVAEHRLGRILVAQQKLAATGREAKVESRKPEDADVGDSPAPPTLNPQPSTLAPPFQPLPIEYRLLTQPDASYFASLTSLATRAVTAESQGSVIEARATLDKTRLPTRAIGAEVRARIGCGTSCLGDVLFGDIVEFVQKYLWW
ncbi:MAG: GAF domain-containing protein [Planctomycetota bacterium]